jgi:hypothetical protein
MRRVFVGVGLVVSLIVWPVVTGALSVAEAVPCNIVGDGVTGGVCFEPIDLPEPPKPPPKPSPTPKPDCDYWCQMERHAPYVEDNWCKVAPGSAGGNVCS